MEKEEKIIAILLVMIVSSLGIAHVMFLPMANDEMVDKYYQLICLNESELFDKVYFEGILINKRVTKVGNHLILNVDYNSSKIEVFIPNDAGAMNLKEKLNVYDTIHIRGIVNEFKDRRQIKVQNEQSIIIK